MTSSRGRGIAILAGGDCDGDEVMITLNEALVAYLLATQAAVDQLPLDQASQEAEDEVLEEGVSLNDTFACLKVGLPFGLSPLACFPGGPGCLGRPLPGGPIRPQGLRPPNAQCAWERDVLGRVPTGQVSGDGFLSRCHVWA